MTYSILWSDEAKKDLKKLDRPVAKRIYSAIGRLRDDPYRNVIKLTNSECFRLRVGDYRVIFDIESGNLRILVLRVGHRGMIYKK